MSKLDEVQRNDEVHTTINPNPCRYMHRPMFQLNVLMNFLLKLKLTYLSYRDTRRRHFFTSGDGTLYTASNREQNSSRHAHRLPDSKSARLHEETDFAAPFHVKVTCACSIAIREQFSPKILPTFHYACTCSLPFTSHKLPGVGLNENIYYDAEWQCHPVT